MGDGQDGVEDEEHERVRGAGLGFLVQLDRVDMPRKRRDVPAGGRGIA